MGRSGEDISHYTGRTKKHRNKDPLFSSISSSSIVPLKKDDGAADIVTKMYVLLKKSNERKRKEEKELLKMERKIRKDSDAQMKSMITGLLAPALTDPHAGHDGDNWLDTIGNTLKNALGMGAGALAAAAGTKSIFRRKSEKNRTTRKERIEEKLRKKEEERIKREQEKQKKTPKAEPEKTEKKGTDKAKKQKKVPTRGSERFKQRSQQPKSVPTPEEPKQPTAEKVESKSPKVSKAILRSLRVFRAVGVVGTIASVAELNDLYEKHKKGEITDHDARNELIKIMIGGLGGTSGAALGAALGSMIAPVAGTLIGGVAGGVGGAFYAEKIAEQAVDYLGDNEIPTSLEEIQNMSKKYVKEHGGDQWGTNETIGQWFEKNTLGKAREYAQEHGAGDWGSNLSWGDWGTEQINSIKSYIDRSVAEQLAMTPQTSSRLNDVMQQHERLQMDMNLDQPIFSNSNFNSVNRGNPTTSMIGEQRVRTDNPSLRTIR
jgi:hypothetical protein